MELTKITPDKERARNILKMISLIEERIILQNSEKMAALIISNYYEIIKELLTAILLIDGYKTLSHKDLIEYVQKNCLEITSYEASLIDDLRVLRNRITYEGFLLESSYLNRNETSFKLLIDKIKSIIFNKLQV